MRGKLTGPWSHLNSEQVIKYSTEGPYIVHTFVSPRCLQNKPRKTWNLRQVSPPTISTEYPIFLQPINCFDWSFTHAFKIGKNNRKIRRRSTRLFHIFQSTHDILESLRVSTSLQIPSSTFQTHQAPIHAYHHNYWLLLCCRRLRHVGEEAVLQFSNSLQNTTTGAIDTLPTAVGA